MIKKLVWLLANVMLRKTINGKEKKLQEKNTLEAH